MSTCRNSNSQVWWVSNAPACDALAFVAPAWYPCPSHVCRKCAAASHFRLHKRGQAASHLKAERRFVGKPSVAVKAPADGMEERSDEHSPQHPRSGQSISTRDGVTFRLSLVSSLCLWNPAYAKLRKIPKRGLTNIRLCRARVYACAQILRFGRLRFDHHRLLTFSFYSCHAISYLLYSLLIFYMGSA